MSKQRLPKSSRVAIGKRLQLARRAVGMTQRDAAKRLKVPITTLASYEQGITEMPFSLLARVRDIYDVQLEEIVFGKRQPNRADLLTRVKVTELRDKVGALTARIKRITTEIDRILVESHPQDVRYFGPTNGKGYFARAQSLRPHPKERTTP